MIWKKGDVVYSNRSVEARDYSAKRGAEKLGVSETEFMTCMKEAGFQVPLA